MLNNLLGRFGISLDKTVTEIMIMGDSTFKQKSLRNKIVYYKNISENKLLVTYVPKLDLDIIESHNLDIFKILGSSKDRETQQRENTSVVISAAITAYARIHMCKIKSYILSRGGNIYYSDTDSIVTDIKLGENMVDSSKLGKLKLEHFVKKGIFISNKTYCLIDDNYNFINNAKGIKSSYLSFSDYEALNNQSVFTAVKGQSKRDWVKGEVKIFDKENITINADSFTKREKILDNNNNKWVDTKPNVINKINNNSELSANKNKLQNSSCSSTIKTKRSFHTLSIRWDNTNLPLNTKKVIYINYFYKDLGN